MRLLLLLGILLLPTVASPCHFPAIFNFGDSNSDTGGLSAAFGPVPSPYGETFFKMPAGRYSDGRLIIDFAAESLGLPHISAFLDSVAANFSHGANFATSLSTILPQNVTLARGGYSPFSLDVQLKQFLQLRHRSRAVFRRGGVFGHLMPREEDFARALYMFDIGQNDLTALYFQNVSATPYLSAALKELSRVVQVPSNNSEHVDRLVACIPTTAIVLAQKVYERGGRSFWIHNTGPLGCLPYVLVRVPPAASRFDSSGCSILFNALAEQFNTMLNETVAQLRKHLPLASVILTDIYSVKYSLFRRAASYGFERPLRACCGHGGGAYNFNADVWCGDTAEVDGTRVLLGKSCRKPWKRIVWDGAHYTEAANKWVFHHISGGEFSYPSVPLSMACGKKTPTT
ncbi:GDSL esterase/lipase At3g26430-like isoform X1 [Musa acuminata AAA Group]|uniref:GDSL esterase/lipase At3g26430-like isoform X1 n=1 Tax=Musa acuminata AAA Group TaxID=214697 RepID=UPI0031E2AF2B